jgi:hypothetical protein
MTQRHQLTVATALSKSMAELPPSLILLMRSSAPTTSAPAASLEKGVRRGQVPLSPAQPIARPSMPD